VSDVRSSIIPDEATIEVAAEPRLVLVHPGLFDALALRTHDGRLLRVSWGDPVFTIGGRPVYETTMTAEDDGSVVATEETLAESHHLTDSDDPGRIEQPWRECPWVKDHVAFATEVARLARERRS
jgi:hypothetical protein